MPRLSVEALKEQIALLQRQLAATERSKAPAVRKVKALMRRLGVEIEDLNTKSAAKTKTPKRLNFTSNRPRPGTKIPTKYRDTEGNAWTGRGKTPKWLSELEKAGKSREDFRVK